MTGKAWQRLAILMADRRRQLAIVAGQRDGVTPIEDADRLAAKFQISYATMAQRVEIDHHWARGSVDTILAGGDPTPLDGLPEAWKPQPRRRGIPPEVRSVIPLTEQHVADAVLAARAVVELADLRDRLEAEAEQLERQLGEARASAANADQRAEEYRERLFTVGHLLHREAVEVTPSCGDGCCADETPLGYCAECGESWKCTTAHVAAGKTIAEARRLVAEQPKVESVDG